MRISDWSSDVCSSDLLADALSGWPVRHPLGDPRNPPVTSLLTPLLGHWGMVLGAAPLGERAAQGFDVAGRRLRLFSAGRFETLPAACRAFSGGRIAHRPLGKGGAGPVGGEHGRAAGGERVVQSLVNTVVGGM